jgi:hypothetical protein
VAESALHLVAKNSYLLSQVIEGVVPGRWSLLSSEVSLLMPKRTFRWGALAETHRTFQLFSQPGGGGMQNVVPARRSLLSFEVRCRVGREENEFNWKSFVSQVIQG